MHETHGWRIRDVAESERVSDAGHRAHGDRARVVGVAIEYRNDMCELREQVHVPRGEIHGIYVVGCRDCQDIVAGFVVHGVGNLTERERRGRRVRAGYRAGRVEVDVDVAERGGGVRETRFKNRICRIKVADIPVPNRDIRAVDVAREHEDVFAVSFYRDCPGRDSRRRRLAGFGNLEVEGVAEVVVLGRRRGLLVGHC